MSRIARALVLAALSFPGLARAGERDVPAAVYAEDLLLAQTRAERIASAGMLGGVALASMGAVLVPMDCRATRPFSGDARSCSSGYMTGALITGGAALAASGLTYLMLAQPRPEELLASARAANGGRLDAPWQLRPRAAPPRCEPGTAEGEGGECLAAETPRAPLLLMRRATSPWLEPGVYVPLMIGAACLASSAWFLAEAVAHQRALADPARSAVPLHGVSGPEAPNPIPGIGTAACGAVSVGAALWVRFARGAPAPLPANLRLHLGVGAVGLSGSFE